jgi:hypothetical protein
MSKIKKAELVAAAKELNNEFGLEPAIATGKTATEESLTEGIIKASKLYDPETDQLTDETLEILEALKPAETSKPKKGAAKEDAEPEPEEADEAPELTEEQEAMLAEIKELKKRDDLLELLDDPMFDEVREDLEAEKHPIKLKAAMKRAITGEVAPPPANTLKSTSKVVKKSTKSFQDLANELHAAGAAEDEVLEAFQALYLERKNETAVDYIKKRAKIYMKIAADAAEDSSDKKSV